MLTKLAALDALNNGIIVIERLVNTIKQYENDYTLLQRRQQQHPTCYELILEAATKVSCVTLDAFDNFETFDSVKASDTTLQLLSKLYEASASTLTLLSELYVRFFETEDTICNDSHGVGKDIKELLKCTQVYSTFLFATKEKYTQQYCDIKKLQTLQNTMIEMKGEFFLQRIQKGKNIPSKRQSGTLAVTLTTNIVNNQKPLVSSVDTTIKQIKDWTVYYNPDVEPAIDLFHHIDCKINSNIINDLTYSTDGKLMAVATGDVAVVYNAKTGVKECELKDTLIRGNVRSVCYGLNSCLIVGQGNFIGVWDISQQRRQYTLDGHRNIYALTYSSKKDYLFSGSSDDTVKIWNIKQQCCVHTLGDKIITNSVSSVALSSEEHLLAAGSYDYNVTIWDINTGAFLSKYIGHTSWVNSVAFSNNSKLVASGFLDDKVKLWDISSGKCIHTFTHHKDKVRSVAFTPSNWLASGSDDKRVIFHDLRAFLVPCTLLQDSNPVGKTFATLSENYIRLWKSWEC